MVIYRKSTALQQQKIWRTHPLWQQVSSVSCRLCCQCKCTPIGIRLCVPKCNCLKTTS